MNAFDLHTDYRITNSNCEDCGTEWTACVVIRDSMALCQRCAPQAFAAASRLNIERWLAGDHPEDINTPST